MFVVLPDKVDCADDTRARELSRAVNMEDLSKQEERALDLKCGSADSIDSRLMVVKLAALKPDAKTRCIVKYVQRDSGNLVRCALAGGASADTVWAEGNVPLVCTAAAFGRARALEALLAGGANPELQDCSCTAASAAAEAAAAVAAEAATAAEAAAAVAADDELVIAPPSKKTKK